MKNASWFSRIGSRILLSSLAPLLIMSLLLTSLMIKTRHDDAEAHLQQLTQSTLNYLAAHAEFGLYSGDVMALEEISTKTLKQEHIVGVSFVSSDHQLLYRAGSVPEINLQELSQQRETINFENPLTFAVYEPVWLQAPNINDFDDADVGSPNEANNPNPTLLGWVGLYVSRTGTIEKQNEILKVTLSSVAIILLLSIWVAYRLGRNITTPVLALSNVIKEFEEKEIAPIAKELGPEELKLLSRGVNELATKVSQSNLQLRQEVENATERLRETLADLETRNSDLLTTQGQLEEAISAKDSFLARMSHELRTPLTSVIGFSKLLNHSTDPNTRKDYTQNILHSSTLLLSIIDDILDFSKMETGSISLDESAFDLRHCLEDLVAMHAYNAHEKLVEIVLLIDTDIPDWVQADAMRLGQVLNNLLGNAIKFTREGEVVLRVSNVIDEQEQAWLQFSVKDSGIGINPDHLSNLFQPFSQADVSIRRRFGGSGLGLVICKQLVELMQGKINVRSELNKGSEFIFTLPLHNAPDFANQPSPTVQDKIAIFDAHPWARRALRNQVSRWSNNVFALKSQQHLLMNIADESSETQLIIIGLSPADTEEEVVNPLLNKIRDIYRGPILILSGLSVTQDSLSRSCQEKFAPIFTLPKPTREKTLVQNIEQIAAEYFPAKVKPQKIEGAKQEVNNIAAKDSNQKPVDLPFYDLNILVAEDNGFNLRLVTELLGKQGAKVKGVHNGAEAVKAFHEQSFDLIIMDIHMPEMDGIAATKRIMEQQSSRAKKTPVIGLTANVIGNEETEMREAGAESILYKPLDEQAIYKAVAEFCNRTPPRETITETPTSKVAELKDELSRLLLELRKQVSMRDIEGIRSILHQLSGLAGLFGIDIVKIKVDEIQRIFHSTPNADLAELVDSLDESIKEIYLTEVIE